MKPRTSTGWALAFAVAAVVFVASYAIQRLAALSGADPDPTTVVNDAFIPYYWRCGLALVHASIALPIVGLAVTDEQAAPILRWAPVWVPGVVLPMALLMVGFP